MDKRHLTSVNTVVRADMCCGCSACAALCPKRKLSIGYLKAGFFSASESVEECLETCNVCLRVCPFSDLSPNASETASELFGGDDLKYSDVAGKYLSISAACCSKDSDRLNSSSGGIATAILSHLLESGQVDAVWSVGEDESSYPSRFKYVRSDSVESLLKTSKSKYESVNPDNIFSRMMEKNEKIAVVGLPCFVRALRNVAKINKRLRDNLVFVVGLTCGVQKTASFWEYIAQKHGLTAKIKTISYRNKVENVPASRFNVNIEDDGGNFLQIPFTDISKYWMGGLLSQPSCSYCDDVFCELADVSLMDAWNSKYASDWRGMSFVVARSRLAESVLGDLVEKSKITLEKASIADIEKSQGVAIFEKRELMKPKLLANRFARKVVRADILKTKYLSSWVFGPIVAWRTKSSINAYLKSSSIKSFERSIFVSSLLFKIFFFLSRAEGFASRRLGRFFRKG